MVTMNDLDRVEILTLQDNYIDMTATDDSAMIRRAGARVAGETRKSVLAEHGFSAVIRTTVGDRTRTMLFDFGFSEIGAAFNARTLGVPMGEIEAIALSHSHGDHMGGFRELVGLIGRPGIELVVHPAAFKAPRYVKFDGGKSKSHHPPFTREMAVAAGVKVVESKEPRPMLGGDVLFLGEIPRRTEFEMGLPNAFYEEGGVEKKDMIDDDTSIVMNINGKGLIVLSGCAHSGIINTVTWAREATGIDTFHVIMGGFHLNVAPTDPLVGRTVEALRKIAPRYIVPTHCTGRKSIQQIEAAMPESFLLNMAGTRLTFAA
ncbi:MAG: MBL fold metallo-hydrolase [Proteobacteria bacterium]|nr:MBL fold metallo-hydrolase [Pseudomonadota bacterium]